VDPTGERRVGDEVIGVRRALPDDAEFLRALFMATKADELGDLPPPMREGLLGQQWLARAAGYAHDFPDAVQYVVVDCTGPIGQLLIDHVEALEVRIVDVSVVAAARGRGIGGHLLEVMANLATDAGIALTLSVAAGNPAIRLYLRSGFTVVQADDAIVAMTKPPSP
jgi:GNAT superfamily N-acetyltransferase